MCFFCAATTSRMSLSSSPPAPPPATSPRICYINNSHLEWDEIGPEDQLIVHELGPGTVNGAEWDQRLMVIGVKRAAVPAASVQQQQQPHNHYVLDRDCGRQLGAPVN